MIDNKGLKRDKTSPKSDEKLSFVLFKIYGTLTDVTSWTFLPHASFSNCSC